MPGLVSQIALVEIGEKGGVREVLKARAIVSHHVCWSWQVESDVAVPMDALVSTGKVTQVRRGTVVEDGALVTRDSAGVLSVAVTKVAYA